MPAPYENADIQAPSTGGYNREANPIIRFSQLGERLDGWADLVDGAGSQAEQTQAIFQQLMVERGIPWMTTLPVTISAEGLTGERRLFTNAFHNAGATITVYIGRAGKDLYLAWDAFIRDVYNWWVILGIIVSSVLLAIPTALSPGYFGGGSNFDFIRWVAGVIGWGLFLTLLVRVTGKILKGKASWYLKNYINEFVADDITAMMLATHHSILQATDLVGIDRSLLRAKEHFKAGQRDRLI